MRNTIVINDHWCFTKEQQPSPPRRLVGEPIRLPHTWNNIDGQDGGNDYHRGLCWYTTELSIPMPRGENEVWLEFDAAAMTADIYLNGEKLAHHDGGYSTFRVELTPHLQENNLLAVSVDNAENDRVYPQKADFTFYGGLYRSVKLITVPKAHFSLGYHGSSGIKVTPEVKGADAFVTVEAWIDGMCDRVEITVADQMQSVQITGGYAKAVFHLVQVHLWDGFADPYLYTATASLQSGDEIRVRFGCRSIVFDPEEGFFLNGRSYPLRGVSRHQDRADVGNALTPAMHEEDISIILEMGANTVRLAHYQHDQYVYDLCDEAGLIVWAEIPYITQHLPRGNANTLSQMTELVMQCYHHPSIICWGLSNEITASGSATDDVIDNHHILNKLCHSLDATRPTTMAHVFMLEIDSPLVTLADISSYNLYYGWYLGELTENDAFFDEFHCEYPQYIMGFSEYGADANPQYQTASPDRGDYSEQYQCLYHEHLLNCIEARPYLWATHLWNMFDFAADGRDEGGAHGLNQKGLVTIDRKLRKDAFYLYKAHWSKESFVHICGRRYVMRAAEVTDVTVYTNEKTVSLLVDGQLLAQQQGTHIFRFQLPLTGQHNLTAVAGRCTDSITICKAAQPNPDYLFQKTEIVNWFDKESIDIGCYSINDKMGDICQTTDGVAIVQTMMKKARASRGDVASTASANAVMQKMLDNMTIASVLKTVGSVFSPDDIQALNDALQKIKRV